MSVRHSLLALLSGGAMHGYGLKTEFEAATADVWPLNVGQVYTTLSRLERDGLVTAEADADGQKVYELTGAGRMSCAAGSRRRCRAKWCRARNWLSSWCSRCGRAWPMWPGCCSGSGWRRSGRCRT